MSEQTQELPRFSYNPYTQIEELKKRTQALYPGKLLNTKVPEDPIAKSCRHCTNKIQHFVAEMSHSHLWEDYKVNMFFCEQCRRIQF